MERKKKELQMSLRQCEIAAESLAASLLARSGYDVLVQYGANQPKYDLVAVKGEGSNERILTVSVKGGQVGKWPLALRKKDSKLGYHQTIDAWEQTQRPGVIFFFVQFKNVGLDSMPRTYVATTAEIAKHLKAQCNGRGTGTLHEDTLRDHPRSIYSDRIPAAWKFDQNRIDLL